MQFKITLCHLYIISNIIYISKCDVVLLISSWKINSVRNNIRNKIRIVTKIYNNYNLFLGVDIRILMKVKDISFFSAMIDRYKVTVDNF